MDLSLQLKEKMLLPGYSTLQQWGYPDSEGYSTLSPTSSIDSFSFSPPYQPCSFAEDNQTSFQTSLPEDEGLQTKQMALPAKKCHRRNRAISHQRHSASEREKMRMRNLSTALQNLRRYLPPAVAPVGKNLTKIETLRLTIRYIAHLSDVLGLDDETLMKRREESLRSSMCPVGLSCCQGNMHEICSAARTQMPETFPQYPNSPSVFPEAASPIGMDTSSTEMYSPQVTDQGLPEETFSPCAMGISPVPLSPVPDMKAFPSQPPVSPDLGFCQDMIDDMWDELENKKLWSTFQPEEPLQLQQFC
ncbi:mesoderm posterior protein 1-like [Dendropsophus ebraccatus]|uniref:mesoderm posterior protein 1-like n=1 Tax=Dendropsophus ebraccatus TaxID=150705 RepID=UPI0038310F84